jgi:RND superfamily putative drug exporter
MTQFGLVLTIGVLVTLAVALTIVPAILRLAGPRVFWPYTGARFQSYAARRRRALESSEGYVARAGRAATRHPWWTLGLILILSAPVVYVAFTVPVSYDISNIGLPPSNPAQEGFNALNQEFGAGYISTSYVLVTFSAPIVVGNEINATEMRDISAVSNVLAETPGIASVRALAGGSGPPLSYWQEYSTLPPAQQATAQGMFGEFVGVNDRTVVFDVTTNATGYSLAAVGAMDRARDGLANFETHHSEIASIHYGGAAQTTGDLQQLVNRTNQDMLIGAALGLFVMLLAILGSAFVPALALGAIGLSILWGWAGTYFVVGILEGEALMFLLPLLLLILILGLGMDYNVLLLTRVREERAKGGTPEEAVRRAVANAGGVIAAAAVILGGAFLLLGLTSPLAMLAGMGLGIGIAVLLQAFVVQMYLTPAVLALGKDRIWKGWTRPGEGASARDA